MYGYIYMIVNKINGKTYIGQRKFNGEWYKDKYMGSGKKLASAKKHYGIESFEKFLVQYVPTKDEASKQEIFWISEYRKRGKAEYNIANGGDGGGVPGHIVSETARKKIGEANSKRMKGNIPWNKGKKLPSHIVSEETKKKISEALKGKHPSEEARKKMSEVKKGTVPWNKGKKLPSHSVSDETRRKISEANRGKKKVIIDGKIRYIRQEERQ